MSEIPPFPNSVNALPPNAKHQIEKIQSQSLRSLEVTAKREVKETFYDHLVYVYRDGSLSKTTSKAVGQRILITV